MILRAVRAELDARLAPGEDFAVALSGGRDSVVLFDALMREARDRVRGAIHVHHGLSKNADAWVSFCETLCGERGLPLVVRHVVVDRGPQTSLESEARRARYEALASGAGALGVTVVALAHHRDDQAETLLLQLLRGAGPRGLASMPPMRDDARGVRWWRPLLSVPRTEIDAYARHRGMVWVDDESNDALHHARNAIRHMVMPAIASVSPSAGVTLARAALHQAEAARLADDLALIDAQDALEGATLAQPALAALPAHRARNLLRWFLHARGLPAPSAARLSAMHAQLRAARADATIRLCHAGREIGLYRGRIHVHAPAPPPYDIAWDGRAPLALAHGTLDVAALAGGGIDAHRLRHATLRVRSRTGGERMQLAHDRPRRALKHILQEAGIPPWEREALPLVMADDVVVAIPGIGVDAAWQAAADARGVVLAWTPK